MNIARIHKGIAQLLGLLIFIQLFLAGLWHAGVTVGPEPHVFLGLGMLLLSLINLILAGVGRLPKRVLGITALFFVLMLLQPILIEFRRNGIPLLSAFHTMNAGILGMTISVLIKATSESVVEGSPAMAMAGD
jgi:hypothetical protein